jgi:hypothetical protein
MKQVRALVWRSDELSKKTKSILKAEFSIIYVYKTKKNVNVSFSDVPLTP